MTVDSYGFVEHFDYMCKYIPQPFVIAPDDIIAISYDENLESYIIRTSKHTYTLTKTAAKKLVDSLGIKIKLLDAISEESDVIDLVLPAVNKLFKCFSDCFVFYAKQEEPLTIIDLNVNSVKGEDGTKYENGPSPWGVDFQKHLENFTCFADFMNTWHIDDTDNTLQVKADDLMQNGSHVVMSLFKHSNETIVPMIVFSSKFSNMNGFLDVHPMLFDTATGLEIAFPMNYSHSDENYSFEEIWSKLNHVYKSTDFNDYIFREVNELAVSDSVPSNVKTFVTNILTDSTLNMNQPVKDILTEAVTKSAQMKDSKKKKFMKQLGALIGWCYTMKHSGCSECGTIHM